MMTVDALMRAAPVIPVLTVADVRVAQPLAAALVAGGLTTLEVTLRTPAALQVITEMAKVDGAVVGAGTVLNPATWTQPSVPVRFSPSVRGSPRHWHARRSIAVFRYSPASPPPAI